MLISELQSSLLLRSKSAVLLVTIANNQVRTWVIGKIGKIPTRSEDLKTVSAYNERKFVADHCSRIC